MQLFRGQQYLFASTDILQEAAVHCKHERQLSLGYLVGGRQYPEFGYTLDLIFINFTKPLAEPAP